jgi:hypothetical protein
VAGREEEKTPWGDVTADWTPNLAQRVISPFVVQHAGKCRGSQHQEAARKQRPAARARRPDREFCGLQSLIK